MLVQLWHNLNSFEFGTPDPTVTERFFFAPPFKILLVNIAYLAFVFKIGPAFMKNRAPFKLKKVLLVYNFLQVILNLYVPIISYLMIIHYGFYEVSCIVSLPLTHSHKHFEIYCFYVYYLMKFIDYSDTVFFVLRKSTRQITFLHVYHHIMMANSGYLYMRYFGFGGHISTMGILNTIVHVFMYFYYFTSALKPTMIDAAWFKKYITRLQLVQFVIIILHNLYPLLYRPDCKSPKFMFYFAILQASIMLYLFSKFYIKTYMKNEKRDRSSQNVLQSAYNVFDDEKTKKIDRSSQNVLQSAYLSNVTGDEKIKKQS